jgi:hypothetical protein
VTIDFDVGLMSFVGIRYLSGKHFCSGFAKRTKIAERKKTSGALGRDELPLIRAARER